MNSHELTLVLGGIDHLTDDLEETIYGIYDDATLGQQGPLVYLDFDRGGADPRRRRTIRGARARGGRDRGPTSSASSPTSS